MPLRFPARAAVACLALAGSAALAPTPALAWEGTVSIYGSESGRRTANGERFVPATRPGHHTCASWALPFGTRVRVTDLATGRSVECGVNDRGPHPRLHRTLDLSHGAAAEIGILARGLIRARLVILPGRGTGRLRLAR